MRGEIREYARIGLVHHMLYNRCLEDPDDHVETLLRMADRSDIETMDCCVPFGQDRRDRLIAKLRGCGKEIVYALHLFPSRKISLGSVVPHEQALIRMAVEDQVRLAEAIGSRAFLFGTGVDIPDRREEGKAALASLCRWLCPELKRRGMETLLEPFDRTTDKKYLLGPSEECVDFIRSLGADGDNLHIELDMAHVPLMGETFAHAIRTTAPYLRRVHLGNCVLQDRTHPLFGDSHPPIGYEAGEIDVPELAAILEELLRVGYLNRNGRGALVFEITAFPGRDEEYSFQDNLHRLHEAWKSI